MAQAQIGVPVCACAKLCLREPVRPRISRALPLARSLLHHLLMSCTVPRSLRRAAPTLAILLGASALACSGSTTNTGKNGIDGGRDSGGATVTGGEPGASGGSANGGSSSASGGTASGGGNPGAGAGGRGPGGAAGGTAGARPMGGRAGASGHGGTGGGGAGGEPGDAGASVAIRCSTPPPLSFPSFSQACERDEDCVLVHRQVDCCASVSTIAIARSEATAFAAAAATCASQFPLCDCLARIPPDASARCLSSRCQVVPSAGATFMCGTKTCSVGQYCLTQTPGAGGVPSSSCETDSKNPACAADCIYCSVAAGCSCSVRAGYVEIACGGV